MRALTLLGMIVSIAVCGQCWAQKSIVPAQPPTTDNILLGALAECDRAAQQASASASAGQPFDPSLVFSPFELLSDTLRRKKEEQELPARLALIEQNRLQCQENARAAALRRTQEAQNEVNAAALGYRLISVEDFTLDAAKLARAEAKVSLRGAYLFSDNIGLLFADQLTIIRALSYPNAGRNEPSVPLLTDDAPRSFRQFLLHCQTNPAAAHTGCPVTITGIVTMCKLTGPSGAERNVPCVAVDSGRPL